MNDLEKRNNLIFMRFEMLGHRQRAIADELGLTEKTVKFIIGKVRNNMSGSQPKKSRIIERNKKIIEDYPKMTPKAMEEKYHLQFEYIKYIATSHRRNDRKEKIKREKKEVSGCGLYADRDMAAIKYFSQIGA
jgi:hypothetical protein